MNPILDLLLNAGGGGAVEQAGRRFGLSGEQTGGALAQLVPALMSGLQRNTSQEGGLEGLLGALNSGNHARFLDRPELLEEDATTEEGNAILGHILGSKDASRAVASQAAAETGIDAGVLKKLLPVAATLVMGVLSKQNAARQSSSEESTGAGDLFGALLGGGGGGAASGVIGLLGRFLGGR